MTVLNRPISFIAAARSCRRTFLGPLIRGTGAIPVERPQDIAFKGEGTIVEVRDRTIIGKSTAFNKLVKGCSLELQSKQ
jgi:glycerol-3-phosphate O-acyltransferase/dihydroxyacetone phosphate acyltransferase